jgi:hypothetical protein
MPEQQCDALAEHCDPDILAPATLHYLYQDQELSMMDIARLARTTEQAVRYALTAAATTALEPRQRTRPVPLPWLQQHYLGSGKPSHRQPPEADTPRNTFAKYAPAQHPHHRTRPRRQPGRRPTHPTTATDRHHRCALRPHGIEYLIQVLAIPGHPSQHAAAAALGLHQVVLMRHH